jgi:uncharacterized repeat protein (TIGR04052 family)
MRKLKSQSLFRMPFIILSDISFKPFIFLCTFLIWSCQPDQSTPVNAELSIRVVPVFSQKPIYCNTDLEIDNNTWKINEFAAFISAVTIQYQGKTYPLDLVDNPWQSQNVALIRQSANCKAETTNLVLSGNVDAGSNDFIEGEPATLHFTLGLPFAVNHQNPVTQPSPLNDSSMFWVWRNGYKFLRWDMQSNTGDSWSFHLGSVGCQSASVVRAPDRECAYPNAVDFVLPLTTFDTPRDLEIALDLQTVLGNITPTNTCMFSSIDDKTCVRLLNNLKMAVGIL